MWVGCVSGVGLGRFREVELNRVGGGLGLGLVGLA